MVEDPYLWLENIDDDGALDWVRQRNASTTAELSSELFTQMQAEALEILDTDTRIPYVRRRGEFLYNFWRDAANPRGLWRRTSLDSYRTDAPDWDVVIDLDELARADGENWVWSGADVIEPDHALALVALSRGGSDATVVREFDMRTRSFVPDGFHLPEAKSRVTWEDHDTVLVGTDFGPDSLTESGYPRIVKRWKRGEPLERATMLFTGSVSDVAVTAGVDRTPGYERTLIYRAVDFYNDQVFQLRSGELVHIDAPTDASISVHRDWLLIELRTDWHRPTVLGGEETYRAGSLLAADYERFLDGTAELSVVFAPDDRTCLHQYAWTRDRLLMVTLADVASRVETVTPGRWTREPVTGLEPSSNTVIVATDPTGDEVFVDSSGFLTPSTLLHGTAGEKLTPIKTSPSFFDSTGLDVAQHFATSDDGTKVPYFVVGRPGAGPGPTLLGGYGGFEVAQTPGYGGVLGRLWLSRGGTYVLANIRGGGEYGPGWHTQAVRGGRHKVAEDFAAVARDLVTRGITTAAQLGAQGGSNGGLLMGIMLTKYPELFGALVCQVPLLDMKRFHLLLAGASWVAEYGDPDDPEEWAFISKYSPYQNISTDKAYPPVLITTSTRDDRVHPGHARKMTAALEESGHEVLYYENIEGGHAGAADNAQTAFKSALAFSFLHRMLSDH
ncbi:MAG: prolyl oligopeptidase family serine peptidase [Mycobacterium sp.]